MLLYVKIGSETRREICEREEIMMFNFIYRKFLCNALSHDAKMKLAKFLWRLPVFHGILERQYDFHPDKENVLLPVGEQREIYDRYLKQNGFSKNDLERIFFDMPHRLVCKHIRYLRVYDRYFSRFRGKKITVVEVGVFGGGRCSYGNNTLGKVLIL